MEDRITNPGPFNNGQKVASVQGHPDREGTDQRDVGDWYAQKTDSILKKYGPGPRVHFHVGIFDSPPAQPAPDSETLRRILVASQERLLHKAAQLWEAPSCFKGNVLDVGCGLGGTAIFCAQEFNSNVTAATIVPEHLPVIAIFAEQAKVTDRLHPVLADACSVHVTTPFDAVIAIESSCYFPRPRWFKHLATIVRPGGYVCIEDPFYVNPEWARPFNDYWRTNIGRLEEYIEAARAAGFILDRNEDITREVEEFWRQSNRWTQSVLEAEHLDAAERSRMLRSIKWHSDSIRAWGERGIETRLLRFRFDR